MKITKFGLIITGIIVIQLGYMFSKLASSKITMNEIFRGDFSNLQEDVNEEKESGIWGKFTKTFGFDNVGEQSPEWESGVFSPDGRYYAYSYYKTVVTSYSRSNGRSVSTGYAKNYFQLIDLETGQKLIKHPQKFDYFMDIILIENNRVWIRGYKTSENYKTVGMYDIEKGELVISFEKILKDYPDIFPKKHGSDIRFYKNLTDEPGVVVEAVNGRQYLINPEGEVNKVKSNDISIMGGGWVSSQLDNSVDGFYFESHASLSVIKPHGVKSEIVSEDEFIRPKFICLNEKDYITSKAELTIYKDGFFVFSHKLTSGNREMILSMIDKNTLKTKWSIEIPQDEQNTRIYGRVWFKMKENILYVANKTHLLGINVDNGDVVREIKL